MDVNAIKLDLGRENTIMTKIEIQILQALRRGPDRAREAVEIMHSERVRHCFLGDKTEEIERQWLRAFDSLEAKGVIQPIREGLIKLNAPFQKMSVAQMCEKVGEPHVWG